MSCLPQNSTHPPISSNYDKKFDSNKPRPPNQDVRVGAASNTKCGQPRPVMLRQQHMDRYLWTTITKAYIERIAQKENAINHDPQRWNSEYSTSFHKVPMNHYAPDDALTRMYPLYGMAAVSFWCPTPVNKAPFGRGSCLTKPNSECYDLQFR